MSDMVEILRSLGMDDVAEEIERLRARVAELEAEQAIQRGTMEQHQSEAEQRQVFGIIQDVPPSTPR